MSGTINRTPCPECNMIGKLYISVEIVAKEIGTFSLAGHQVKFSGKELPVLKCNNCDFSLVGRFDGEGHSHAVFDPSKKESGDGEATR